MRFFALLLLSVTPTLSFALSLGDIELQSHLGEPLNVKVEITDSETPLETGCFTIADTGDVQAFRKVSIVLKQNSGQQVLSITTSQAITEPIVNLRVSFHCDPHIDREYVLLIDPAPLVSAEAAASENHVDTAKSTNPNNKNSDKNKSLSGKSKISAVMQQIADRSISLPSAAETQAAAKPVKNQRAKKKKTSTSSIDDKLMEAYIGKQQTPSAIKPAATVKGNGYNQAIAARPNTDKPFLTISGGNTNSGENNTQPSLSLRLETQLNLNRHVAGLAPLSTTDAMDEVTVMANRLAHLEKQILSLQNRNLQLQAEAEQAKNEGFRLSPNQSKWLHNILIALGITAALACIEWLRRKLLRDRLNKDEAIWFDAEPADKPSRPLNNNLSSIESAVFGDSMFDNNVSVQNLSSGSAQAEKSESDNVLEHAEVFIVHGRPILAIQLLQNHLEESPTASPTVWLKLLSLLAKEGSEAEYSTTVSECNQFFNVKMPSFAKATDIDTSSIEDHPHIVDRLQGVWGSQYVIGFLDDLIYNHQAQPREGFERGTFEELFFLKQIAEILQSSNKLDQNPNIYKPDNIQPVLEKIAVNQTLFASNISETDSTLQTPVVPEVDFLLDIEEAPKDNEVAVIEINLPTPKLDTTESSQVTEIDFPTSTAEIDSSPTINVLEDIVFENDVAEALELNQNELETEKSDEKTNVIEFDWDLPKINKD